MQTSRRAASSPAQLQPHSNARTPNTNHRAHTTTANAPHHNRDCCGFFFSWGLSKMATHCRPVAMGAPPAP